MATPYITPDLVEQAATGIDWTSLVFPDSNTTQTNQEINNICWRATEMIDAYCNQVLRATLDWETVNAPGDRAWPQSNGACRVWLSRWPVLKVVQAQASQSRFPTTFRTLTAGQDYEVRQPGTIGLSTAASGSSSVDFSPSVVGWLGGREGTVLQIQYINGWPHSQLTVEAQLGDAQITVDDTTGFAGQVFTIYDGAETEMVTCTTSSTVTGPGTLTLASTLLYGHHPGLLSTAIPAVVHQAAIYLATNIALLRGTTALALPTAETMAGGKTFDYATEAFTLVGPFRRVY